MIGDEVTITIVRIGPNNVRIGIEAPRTMNIRREELQTAAPQEVAVKAACPPVLMTTGHDGR